MKIILKVTEIQKKNMLSETNMMMMVMTRNWKSCLRYEL